jgi:hypothetical protein
MKLEVMIIEDVHGAAKRHYVLAGFEVTLCGSVSMRRPGPQDRYIRLCLRCSAAADALYRKGL